MDKFFHIFLQRKKHIHSNSYTQQCLNYIERWIKPYFGYKIWFFEKEAKMPDLDDDVENIFIWDQSLVKQSFDEIESSPDLNIVFLKKKTSIFFDHTSKTEPIDENFVIFNNMKCIYLRPDKNETDYDYDTIITDDQYTFDITTIIPDYENLID